MQSALGAGFVLLFVFGQAVRDVYFANLFQGLDFFEIALLTFAACTMIFAVASSLRAPGVWRRFRGRLATLLWVNLATGAAWLGFFYAIKHLEPAVASTLYMGVGPLTILALDAGRRGAEEGAKAGRAETFCYVGLAFTMVALWLVALSGASGVAGKGTATVLAALSCASFGGAAIALGHFGARQLNDSGIGSDAVMATRFLGIVLVTALIELADGTPAEIASLNRAVSIGLAAVLLIVLPSFALQLGVARASPLTVNVVRALGPVFLFFVQLVDARIAYAPATLACVVANLIFAIGVNGLRAWRGSAGLLVRSH